MLPDRTLDGRVAIVTGGGTGIGRAIALEYARLGARLVLASRSPEHLEPAAEELRATFGAEVLTAPTDVRVPEQVERLCEEAVRRFGSIDILVNNAAGNFFCPAEKLSPNGWQAVVNIVLNGTFYCSRAAGLRMIAGGRGGNILNLVAAYAWTGGPGTIHSACAKAGVVCMTRAPGQSSGELRRRGTPCSRRSRAAASGHPRKSRRRAPTWSQTSLTSLRARCW